MKAKITREQMLFDTLSPITESNLCSGFRNFLTYELVNRAGDHIRATPDTAKSDILLSANAKDKNTNICTTPQCTTIRCSGDEILTCCKITRSRWPRSHSSTRNSINYNELVRSASCFLLSFFAWICILRLKRHVDQMNK